MHCVTPRSDGIEGLVMCSVSCGDRVRYVLRGSPPASDGISSESVYICCRVYRLVCRVPYL